GGEVSKGQRVNFYFNEHTIVNQATHLDHGRARPDLAEKFAVSAPELLPTRDVRDEHPRPHDVFQTRSQSGERAFDVAYYLNRLRLSVPEPDDSAAHAGGVLPGHKNLVADQNSRQITDYRLHFVPVE